MACCLQVLGRLPVVGTLASMVCTTYLPPSWYWTHNYWLVQISCFADAFHIRMLITWRSPTSAATVGSWCSYHLPGQPRQGRNVQIPATPKFSKGFHFLIIITIILLAFSGLYDQYNFIVFVACNMNIMSNLISIWLYSLHSVDPFFFRICSQSATNLRLLTALQAGQ